jgi:plastocyanin
MTSTSRLVAAGFAVSLALAALAGWGCGETGDTDPTPVQTFKITPAANATLSPIASAATGSPTAPPTPLGTPAGTSIVAITGISNTFDIEEIDARTGSITIEFDNRDGGIVHNIHFFKGDDANDESVAETELEVGPIKQTLTFVVQPGAYFYQCDAHPTTMEGTLSVK